MHEDLFFYIISVAIAAVVVVILLWINRSVFKRIHKKRDALQLRFIERFIAVVIVVGAIIIMISSWGGANSVWKTLLGGTAIVSAVMVFAAQDLIKDILAGLMISINKPFKLGDRIELEDGTCGVVKDITMRHIVILKLDTIYAIIPNSQINTQTLTNYSFLGKNRSARFDFYVAYDTDVEKAMKVIRYAIEESEYSIPGKETKSGMDYAPIYFMAYEDSSLKLSTTVYFEDTVASEVLISDINLRVNNALKENEIEIPYNYINVIEKLNHSDKVKA